MSAYIVRVIEVGTDAARGDTYIVEATTIARACEGAIAKHVALESENYGNTFDSDNYEAVFAELQPNICRLVIVDDPDAPHQDRSS